MEVGKGGQASLLNCLMAAGKEKVVTCMLPQDPLEGDL